MAEFQHNDPIHQRRREYSCRSRHIEGVEAEEKEEDSEDMNEAEDCANCVLEENENTANTLTEENSNRIKDLFSQNEEYQQALEAIQEKKKKRISLEGKRFKLKGTNDRSP